MSGIVKALGNSKVFNKVELEEKRKAVSNLPVIFSLHPSSFQERLKFCLSVILVGFKHHCFSPKPNPL